MKKLSLFCSALMVILLSANAHAHKGVKTSGFEVAPNGMKFDAINFAMEPENRQGGMFFVPSDMSVKPVERNTLEASNTVGALKTQMVKAINEQMSKEPLNYYTPVTSEDIEVYGGYSIFTENSFTDARVFQASPVGSAYRVKVTLTPVDPKQTIQTAVEGIFTLYAR